MAVDNQTQVQTLTNLTALINGHIGGLDRQREELGKLTEMLDGILSNDPGYQEAANKAKEVIKEKSKAKANVLQQATAKDLNFKIKENRAEIKQLQAELSNFLAEFQRLSGSNEFEGEDGEMRKIVFTARLVGKTNFNDKQG